jgi:hypothetical protein
VPSFKAPKIVHWERVSHKPTLFPPAPHETDWSTIINIPPTVVDGQPVTWDEIEDKPATFPPSAHTHVKAAITDFPTTWPWEDVSGKPTTWGWADLTNVPDEFPPEHHTHLKEDITDFPTTWDWPDITNVPASFPAAWSDITGKPSTFPPSAHTHVKADITDFPSTWAWNDISGKPSTFPPSAHTHVIADVTGLQTALDTKLDKPLVISAPSAISPAYGTAYQTTNAEKPSIISAMIDAAYTVTVAGTLADTVELRVGANQAQVAAGTGGIVVASFRASLTGIALAIGLGLGQRNQLIGVVPAGYYWALRRTQGSAANIQNATEQSIG